VSYLFVFRTGPDIDHMSPLAWKLLEEGEDVEIVLSPGYDVAGDHRIDLLRSYPRLTLHHAPSGTGLPGRISAAVRSTLPAALLRLWRGDAKVVAVEWGYGLPTGYDRLKSPAGAVALVRSLGRSLVKAWTETAAQMRASYVVAARMLRIPTVCLPHGLSVKLDMASETEIQDLLRAGPLEWQDRNRFTAFVFNTEHHRQWSLENANGDPAVMQTWGSVRWSPEWFEKSRELAPPFSWPEDTDRLKVIYMAPRWPNMVHADLAIDLARRLSRMDEISLALLGHPRAKSGSTGPMHAAGGIDWAHTHDISGTNSVSAIGSADVVIDAGSSIGIEVVMQDKVLINPAYIHELKTLFDSIEDAAVVAHSADDIVGYLRDHAGGRPHRPSTQAVDQLMREAVYGSREAPFDVLGEYSSRVRSLTTQGDR